MSHRPCLWGSQSPGERQIIKTIKIQCSTAKDSSGQRGVGEIKLCLAQQVPSAAAKALHPISESLVQVLTIPVLIQLPASDPARWQITDHNPQSLPPPWDSWDFWLLASVWTDFACCSHLARVKPLSLSLSPSDKKKIK